LCKKYRKIGASHRDIAKKLQISLGSAFKYTKGIRLSKKQHLALKLRNLPRITFHQRRLGGLHSPCKFQPKYTKEDLTNFIRKFYKERGRIPTKREVSSHKPYVRLFNSWNNAIKRAGFEPNPVMFAKKYIANDGHKCDSLAEKIIDDWLYARRIEHKIHVPYPGNNSLTADFVVENNWIEFFGLDGELVTYDLLKKKKLRIAKRLNLSLTAIYPRDLFPKCRLDKILNHLQPNK